MNAFLCRNWITLYAIMLAGNMFFTRSFAQIGYPPIFVVDVTLVLGLIVWFLSGMQLTLLNARVFVALIPLFIFVALGISATVPNLDLGLSANRDAVLWGYSAFSILAIGFYRAGYFNPTILTSYFSTLWSLAPFFYAIVAIAVVVGGKSLPTFPGSEVQIFTLKGGSVCCFIAGLFSFYLLGLRRPQQFDSIRILLFIGMAAMCSAITRAGAIGLGAGLFVTMLSRGLKAKDIALAILFFLLIAFLYITDVDLQLTHRERQNLSVRQIIDNFGSIIGLSDTHTLNSTSDMRKEWWKQIIDYTIHGPYFWTGKGFGVNIALEDGHAVFGEEVMVNPHSIHFTILARMGVPGLVAWMTLIVLWLIQTVRTCIIAASIGDRDWQYFFTILISMFVAILVNCSFDTAFETPYLGSWFWSIYGIGIASRVDFTSRLRSENI